jgi:hypothetical protein
MASMMLTVYASIYDSFFRVCDSFFFSFCSSCLILNLVRSTSLCSNVSAIAYGTLGLVTLTAMTNSHILYFKSLEPIDCIRFEAQL